ncbi:MAG: hypothetical protein B6D68_03810 [spirochete symbiont of Stewartia floridana]|nr:MAG: hypothetical protein B6D68_03810 [spirochete symbiont of Stewartia floridana]
MKQVLLLSMLAAGLVMPLAARGNPEVSSEGDWALTILHTNDVHSHLDVDYKERYGAAKIGYMADKIKAAYDNVLLLDAGDYVMGTVYYSVFEGEADRKVMNLLDYDAMTLGNHEFDYGNPGLMNFISELETPIVGTTIDFSEYPEIDELVDPYIIRDMDGRKVGIIGATVPETTTISSPAEGIVFNDVISSVQPIVDELEAEDVDVIVLLSHNGYIKDQEFAAQLDGVDVIVGGHSHTLVQGDDYPTVLRSASDEPVLVVQAGSYNKYLGNLTVTFDDAGVATSWWGDPILMAASVPLDEEIADYVAGLSKDLEPLIGKVLGTVKTELTTSRVAESSLGNFITDAMLYDVRDQGVQVALTNGGGIRADVGTGDLTMGKLMEVLPFGNLIATFEIKGSDLRQVFEHGVSRTEEQHGRFLQMAGARIVWDPAGEPFDYATQTGGRITEVYIDDRKGGWNPLDPDAIYKVAANNYIRAGGDGYLVLKEKAIDPYDAGTLDLDAIEIYMEEVLNSVIDYKPEGRIQRVGQ